MGILQNRGRVVPATATSTGLTIASTTYAVGDVLGDELVFNLGVGAGKIIGATVVDDGDVIATSITLYLFSGVVTAAADNAANAFSDADAAKLVGVIALSTISDFVNNKAASWVGTQPFRTDSGALYVVAVTGSTNAVFTAVDDLHYTLFIEA